MQQRLQLNISESPPSADIQSFISLCNELISFYFNDYNAHVKDNSLPISAFRVVDKTLFKVLPLLSNNLSAEFINKDISALSKLKSTYATINYFSQSNKFDNPFILNNLKNHIKKNKISFDIWSYSKIVQHLQPKIGFQRSPLYSNADLQHLFDKSLRSPAKQITIIDEICSYIYSIHLIPISFKAKQLKLDRLQTKLAHNFCETEQTKVHNSYIKLWQTKELVDKYIRDNISINTERIFALLNHVQNKFKELNSFDEINYPVNFHRTIIKISRSLIPAGKHKIVEYTACAESIVLYFFEMCDIGERYKNEQLSFLQQYGNDHDIAK